MIEFKLRTFIEAQEVLVQASIVLHSSDEMRETIRPETKESLINHLAALMDQLVAHDFDLCAAGLRRLLATCERTSNTPAIVSEVDDLRRRLIDQAQSVFCLSLNGREREMYDCLAPPFGDVVEAVFRSANDDIYEAQKCLALGRATACVMHLMRVVEAGLAALAASVGVTKQNDWGAYLRKIDDELLGRAKSGRARSDDEQFYAEAAVTIDHMRRAWRNPTMHLDRSYSIERATEIRDSVRSFMIHLASKVSE
jgi:hypothetical protein